MIGYLDTSSFVPMLIAEPTSAACTEFWRSADAVVADRILYVEAAAALARAERTGRFTGDEHPRAVLQLDRLFVEFQVTEVDDRLVHVAADLAHRFGLRGYDAVHCAAAAQLDDADLVAASGDRKLVAAWRALGIATYDPADPR